MYSMNVLYWSAFLALILSCTRASDENELLSPINIITSEVKYDSIEKPVHIITRIPYAIIDVTLENTGDAIISRLRSPISPVTFTGPLLNNEKYLLNHQTFYVNQSLGRSGHEINGKGYPIEALKVLYKKKYNTFDNATKYNGGVLVFSQPVDVNDLVNPLFLEFEAKLGEVKNPNSSTITTTAGSVGWYDSFLLTHAFLKYEGSYYDPVMKKQLSGATQLVGSPTFYSSISHSQFKAFQNLLGNDGKPLNSVTPIYPQGSRKVEGTRGILATYYPTGITIPLL